MCAIFEIFIVRTYEMLSYIFALVVFFQFSFKLLPPDSVETNFTGLSFHFLKSFSPKQGSKVTKVEGFTECERNMRKKH